MFELKSQCSIATQWPLLMLKFFKYVTMYVNNIAFAYVLFLPMPTQNK